MTQRMDALELPVVDRPDWPRPEAGTFPILVGVTFDAAGDSALRFALEMARWRSGAQLHLAHVLVSSPLGGLSNRASTLEQRMRELEQYPRRLAELARASLPAVHPPVAVHVRVGDPAHTLLQLALDYNAKMVVVGTHGRKGLERLVLGSVAQRLLDARRCPVVVATDLDFDGMQKTLIPDPECPDCVEARKRTDGAQLWCEHHGRAHVHTSLSFQNSEWLPMGGHDPGLIP